ncbi:MAG: bifunctional heptose 7-phosphate kinase/heptose 1-phosphate adenyltransferase, partial [Planctomycetota bacterium]|nr:bifunctional heptose 7-phosphate kinase/heptose 1-phosphate adenyltransferase [Planctomycetota bacterium]
STLLTSVMNMKNPNIVIVGDFMLDESVFGDAERLSPDAPVPVLEVKKTESLAGGSGNVARCVSAMGGKVTCIGVIGKDAEGQTLKALLEEDGINAEHLIACQDRPTTVKRSLVGLAQHRHPQKMFRLDRETKEAINSDIESKILSALNKCLQTADVVCIEDYGKGVLTASCCQSVIQHCREAGVRVIVDPANIDDYSIYAGATAITPNRTEAEQATGTRLHDDEPIAGAVELANRLCEELKLHAAVVTLDKHGAVVKERKRDAKHIPTTVRTVYDVTGAGDMVLAAIAMGRASGMNWIESVKFANVAAGLEVEMFGATPIPIEQIKLAVIQGSEEGSGKVRSGELLEIELNALKQAGKRIVLTNGCFDVIHAGHVSYLREAAKLGDVLVVGVNSDSQVKAQKGENRPVYSLDERMEILAELQCVSLVTSFEEPTAEALIKLVQPNLYVKGGDYAKEEINEFGLLSSLGIEVDVLSHRPGRSSTQVTAQLRGEE